MPARAYSDVARERGSNIPSAFEVIEPTHRIVVDARYYLAFGIRDDDPKTPDRPWTAQHQRLAPAHPAREAPVRWQGLAIDKKVRRDP